MNEYLFLIPIAIASIIGVMSPGPSFIFVAQVTLNKSREHGIATSLGLGTGAVVFTMLACFGLFVVLEAAPFLYGALKVLGGLYLLYLAYKIWNSSKESGPTQTVEKTTSIPMADKSTHTKLDLKQYLTSYILGLLTQLSNPKTAIVIGSMIMAFLPQEVPPYSFLIIAILTFIIDSGWYCIVSIVLSTEKAQKVYNRFKRRINQISSGLLAFLGVKLAFNL